MEKNNQLDKSTMKRKNKANRERNRMRKLKEAFNKLCNVLPFNNFKPKSSYSKTIRQAVKYIKALENKLENNDEVGELPILNVFEVKTLAPALNIIR